ncbi:MAG: ImmA/IrrE family metallo-endopeptidase [Oscillospiraceae bacterium]|nr:ImmA/IrrE family metallo-endopeptidase [Oscillospiraceae bacterium]
MMTEREERVVRLSNELVRRHALTLPVDVAALCPLYGARLLSLSELEEKGLDPEAVFAVWGNRDGVAMASRRGRTIGYNDRAAEKRIRFTLAEELMHLLLGHTEDARFRLGEQSYDEATYALYEEEAKRGACMLLIPPTVYFRYRALYGVAGIARLCRVSHACAWTAAQYYDRNEKELRALFTARPLRCDTRSLPRRTERRPVRVSV